MIMRKFLCFMKQVLCYGGMYVYLMRKCVALSLAIMLANFKQRAFNRRFFVVLDHRDRLITLCNADVKRLKELGYLSKRMTHYDLLENSFYYTPVSRNNDGCISVTERNRKRRMYYRYMRLRRKLAVHRSPVSRKVFNRKG